MPPLNGKQNIYSHLLSLLETIEDPEQCVYWKWAGEREFRAKVEGLSLEQWKDVSAWE